MSKPVGFLFRVLILGVVLRSLIAPGYMLDFSNRDAGFGVSVILCEGLNGINAVPGLEQIHHGHGTHGQHDPSDSQTHEHDSAHFTTATCGLWTASGIYLKLPAMDLQYLLPLSEHYLLPAHTAVSPGVTPHRNHPARASPLFFLA